MKQQEIRLLACDEEVLNEADDILVVGWSLATQQEVHASGTH